MCSCCSSARTLLRGRSLSVTVYNTGLPLSKAVQPRKVHEFSVVDLPNLGRDGMSLMYHMSRNYHCLKE